MIFYQTINSEWDLRFDEFAKIPVKTVSKKI